MIKVLYVDVPLIPPGGGQFSLLTILSKINRHKYIPVVVLPYSCTFKDMVERLGICVDIAASSKLFDSIRKFRPDIIHCNSATTRYTFYAALASRIAGIPFIWHVRVIESAGWKDKVIAMLSTKIITVSNAVAQKFRWIGGKVVTVYNGVDTEKFRAMQVDPSLYSYFGLDSQRPVVGIISRLVPWKGHNIFLEAASILWKERQDRVNFLIAGDGDRDYLIKLKEMVEKLGLSKAVVFIGFRQDMPIVINLCEAIVNPSLEPEPFGRTLIEAMACEKPVIATNIGGAPEIVVDGVTGILVPPRNPEALADAIGYILDHPKEAKMMGKEGRKRVEWMFDLKRHVRQVEGIYEALLYRKTSSKELNHRGEGLCG